MGEESRGVLGRLTVLDSYVFKVYVNDPRRFEIGGWILRRSCDGLDLEWDGFEVKKDRQGGYVEAS